MTHDELLKHLDEKLFWENSTEVGAAYSALRAVVELHKPKTWQGIEMICDFCDLAAYPCPTIQAIEKELG